VQRGHDPKLWAHHLPVWEENHLAESKEVEQFARVTVHTLCLSGALRPLNIQVDGIPPLVIPLHVVVSGGKFRLIFDLRLFNCGEWCEQLPMPGIRNLRDWLCAGDLLLKGDLKSGYHQIRMNAKWHAYCAIEFDGVLYALLHLPFGLSSAVRCFQELTSSLATGLSRFTPSLAYIDDFLFRASPGDLCPGKGWPMIVDWPYKRKDLCLNQFGALVSFGLILGAGKCEGPSTLMVWIGFLIDTVKMFVTLSSQRVDKLHALLEQAARGVSLPNREWAKLAGYIASAEPGGLPTPFRVHWPTAGGGGGRRRSR